jgi:hypothetical protein
MGYETEITETLIVDGDHSAYFVEGDFGGDINYLQGAWIATEYARRKDENPKFLNAIIFAEIARDLKNIHWDAGHE